MPVFMFIGGKNPGSQTITSGAGTFTVPYFAENFRVRLWGSGGGGQGKSTVSSVNGGMGTDTTFGSLTAGAGGPATVGVASGGDVNTNGNASSLFGGEGAEAPETSLGGGAAQPYPPGNSTGNGLAGNPFGGGGSTAKYWASPDLWIGRGGSSGAFCQKTYTPFTLSPGSVVSYSIGVGGGGGIGSSSTGGAGASGGIQIDWDY